MRIDNTAVAVQDELIALDKASQGRAEARNEYRSSIMMADIEPTIELFNHIRALLQKRSSQRTQFLRHGEYLEAVRYQAYLKTITEIIQTKGSSDLVHFLKADLGNLAALPYELELYLYKNNLDDIKDIISSATKFKAQLELE